MTHNVFFRLRHHSPQIERVEIPMGLWKRLDHDVKYANPWTPSTPFSPWILSMNSNNFMTWYIHRTILANPCQIWTSFGNKKTKHKSKDKSKMHHWCLCCCWLLLGTTTWNLIALGFHSIVAFKITHSKFTQLTFKKHAK
jgi:hypothetical protein